MKKKAQWQVITTKKPLLSPPRGQLRLVVDNSKTGPIENMTPDLQDSIHLWTKTPIKTILKTIEEARHPAALNAIQKLTVNHSKRLIIMMALFDARNRIYRQGA
jgi:hypothetical protein